MDWIETQLDDETLFPQRLGNNNNNNICQGDLKQYPLLHPNMLIYGELFFWQEHHFLRTSRMW